MGTLWLIGCGNMGGAMLRRWVASEVVASASVTVIDPGTPDLPSGVRHLMKLPSGEAPDTVVLAVKPQQLDQVAAGPLRGMAPRRVVSILAGVEQAALRQRFAADTIVRAMPNLPVSIGAGVVALYSDSEDTHERALIGRLMAPLGLTEWIGEESLFDAVTALSGCGPGFVFRFADALAAAGTALGLPADQAQRLAIATVTGSALLASDADASPATLADRVASPGGSTREGLNVLDADDALRRLMLATLTASARRNAEMAAAARS